MEDLLDDFSTFYLAGKNNDNIMVYVLHTCTVYLLGQETTGNLLSFTLIMLIQHPNVLARYGVDVEMHSVTSMR